MNIFKIQQFTSQLLSNSKKLIIFPSNFLSSYYSSQSFRISQKIRFSIKSYKYIDQKEQKLQIKSEKGKMDTNNRSQYLSRIQEIRSKIQSKQTTAKQVRSKQYEQSQCENISKYDKMDHLNYINQLQKRKPLQSVQNKVTHFQERVTKLDSVSERIKNILSAKRPIQEHENHNEKMTKNQKITSLFQKEINVAESKVAEVSFNEIRARQFGNFSKDKMSLPMTNINTNTAQKQNKTKVSLQKIEKTPVKVLYPSTTQKSSEISYDTYKAKTLKDTITESAKAKYSFQQHSNYTPKQTNTQIQKDTSYSSIRDYHPYKKESVKENNYTGTSYSITSAPSKIEKQMRNEPKKQPLNLRTTFQMDSFPQTKRLIEILSKQIELQVSLRGSKEKFDAFRSQGKLNTLKQQLSKRKISLSQKQIDEWIKIDDEEFDPFVSIIFKKEFNFDDLINNLIQAKNHWQQKVRKCVNSSQLKKQEFKLKQIDANRRGQIYLQDFVCYINLKNDSSLRNRDLYSLFKHFMLLQYSTSNNEHKIREQTFLNYVAK